MSKVSRMCRSSGHGGGFSFPNKINEGRQVLSALCSFFWETIPITIQNALTAADLKGMLGVVVFIKPFEPFGGCWVSGMASQRLQGYTTGLHNHRREVAWNTMVMAGGEVTHPRQPTQAPAQRASISNNCGDRKPSISDIQGCVCFHFRTIT